MKEDLLMGQVVLRSDEGRQWELHTGLVKFLFWSANSITGLCLEQAKNHGKVRPKERVCRDSHKGEWETRKTRIAPAPLD